MSQPAHLFLLLQHSDSFFPSGAVSFSWGLEGAGNEGWVSSPAELQEFLEVHLRGRWAKFDRVFLRDAYASAADPEALAELDWLLEAMTLPEELRLGSRRAGGAFLLTHEKLGTPGARDYRRRQRAGEVPGHLAAMQGLVGAGLGLALTEAETLSAYTSCAALLSAAVRLGLVGNVESQRILTRLGPAVGACVAAVPPEHAASFAPLHDLAAVRHEAHEERLFFN